MTPDDVATAVGKELDRRRGQEIEHKEHHAFVQKMIEREERKQEMWEKIKAQVLGWGVIALVGGIGTAVYNYLFK